MRLSVPRLFKYLLRLLPQYIDLALARCDHSIDVLPINVIYVGDPMISVLAYSTPEAHSDLAIPAVPLDLLTGMLSASLV